MRIFAIIIIFVAILFGVWKATFLSLHNSDPNTVRAVAREDVPPAIAEPAKPISAVTEQIPNLLVAVVYISGFLVPNGMALLEMFHAPAIDDRDGTERRCAAFGV